MKNVIVRLVEFEHSATEAEKSIIKELLKEPKKFVGLSIHQFAHDTFSSASTIVRLIKKLGFKGYKDFQSSMLYELAISDSLKLKDYEIEESENILDVVSKITQKNINSLENTMKLIEVDVLEKVVTLMEEAKGIYFFGIGSSLLVGKDAQLKFLRINKPCFILDDWHSQILQAKNMRNGDLAIIISYSGLTSEIIECAKLLHSKNIPIIAITRFKYSPLSKLSDYNLWVSASENVERAGAMSSRMSQLNIIDILYSIYISRNYTKLRGTLSASQMLKNHLNSE